MIHSGGFGLIGILIALAVAIGIGGAGFYTIQNIGKVDTLDGEGEKQSISSIIQKAENAKKQIEDRDVESSTLMEDFE